MYIAGVLLWQARRTCKWVLRLLGGVVRVHGVNIGPVVVKWVLIASMLVCLKNRALLSRHVAQRFGKQVVKGVEDEVVSGNLRRKQDPRVLYGSAPEWGAAQCLRVQRSQGSRDTGHSHSIYTCL